MFEYFTFFNLKYLLFWILWIYDLSCSILYQPIYGLNPTTQLIFMNRFVGNALFFINCNQSGFYHSSWIYSNLAFYWLVQIEIFIASETLWSNSQICKGRKKYMNFNLNKWLVFHIFYLLLIHILTRPFFGFDSMVVIWDDHLMFLRKMNS